jgi:hypothetical protein
MPVTSVVKISILVLYPSGRDWLSMKTETGVEILCLQMGVLVRPVQSVHLALTSTR